MNKQYENITKVILLRILSKYKHMKYKEKLNQIKAVLGLEVKLEQMKLDNGTVVEAEVFEPDNEIFVVTGEDRVPIPVGEYVLEDGKILVIAEEGIIAEIKEAVAEEEAPEGEAPPEQEMEAEPASPKKIVESISKELFFAEIDKLKAEIEELKLSKVEPEKVEEVAVELAEEVKPIIASPESVVEKKATNLYSQNKSKTVQSTVWAKLANIKH